MQMMITVLSDDINKSKEFANLLMSSENIIDVKNIKNKMTIDSNRFHCRALTPRQLSRGMRHNKFYIDSNATISEEIYHTLISAKILPIFLGRTMVKLEIKNPIEIIDFDEYIQ